MKQYLHQKMIQSKHAFTQQQQSGFTFLTYNVHESKPVHNFILTLFNYGLGRQHVHTLVLCLQEVEKALQDTQNDVFICWYEYLTQQLPEYHVEVAEKVAGTALFIFSRLQFENKIVKSKRLGVGCKGAIGASFQLNSQLFLIIGSHLAHDQDQYEKRNKQFNQIMNEMQFPSISKQLVTGIDIIQHRSPYDHDFIFWLGDLNYRLNCKFTSQNMHPDLFNHAWLAEYDQLSIAISKNEAFMQFNEPQIGFPPTYKFKGDFYDSERTPSWCDRILFFERENMQIPEIKFVKEDEEPTETVGESKPEVQLETVDFQQVSQKTKPEAKKAFAHFDMHIKNVQPLSYYWMDAFKQSDHRAVCGIYQIKTLRVDLQRQQMYLAEQCKQYQKMLIQQIPIMELEPVIQLQNLVFNKLYPVKHFIKTKAQKLDIYLPLPLKQTNYQITQVKDGFEIMFNFQFVFQIQQSDLVFVASTKSEFELRDVKKVVLTLQFRDQPFGKSLQELEKYKIEDLKIEANSAWFEKFEGPTTLNVVDGLLEASSKHHVALIEQCSEFKLLCMLIKQVLPTKFIVLLKQAKNKIDVINVISVLEKLSLECKYFAKLCYLYAELHKASLQQTLLDFTTVDQILIKHFKQLLIDDEQVLQLIKGIREK